MNDSFTLTDISRRLAEPQHRLIHLCEQGVVKPDVHDASGRGSSRLFSARNVLEFAIALRLRTMNQPNRVAQAVLHALRAFQREVSKEVPGFALPDALRVKAPPDLRIIVSDGATLFFQLGMKGSKPKLFGGVQLDRASRRKAKPEAKQDAIGFGGPENSRFGRLELSITRIAQELPLDT